MKNSSANNFKEEKIMTNYDILETQSLYMEAHTFSDLINLEVKLGYSTFVTSGIEAFINSEMDKTSDSGKIYEILNEVTLVTNDDASITCEALIYVGVIPGSLEFNKDTKKLVNKTALFVKINTEDAASINMDDIKYIKYKNYVFKSNAHTMKYNTEDSTKGMHNFTYFIIDLIEEDTVMNNSTTVSFEEDAVMKNSATLNFEDLSFMFNGYELAAIGDTYVHAIDYVDVVTKYNCENAPSLCNKDQFDLVYDDNINPNEYSINKLAASIERVEIRVTGLVGVCDNTTIRQSADNEIHVDPDCKNPVRVYENMEWHIWFKGYTQEDGSLIYPYKKGYLAIRNDGFIKCSENGKWKELPWTNGHKLIKFNFWNRRLSVETLVLLCSDIYNYCMLNDYTGLLANSKLNMCSDAGIKKLGLNKICLSLGDLEWTTTVLNLRHASTQLLLENKTKRHWTFSANNMDLYEYIDKLSMRPWDENTVEKIFKYADEQHKTNNNMDYYLIQDNVDMAYGSCGCMHMIIDDKLQVVL